MDGSNKQIRLARRPVGTPTLEDFSFTEAPIGTPGEGEVLIRNVYISVDPYLRGRMEDVKSYIPPFQLNDVIISGVIGQVVESKSAHFAKGDIVIGMLGWEEYSVAHEKTLRKLDPALAPVTANLGIIGMTGLTAYFGLLDIGQPKEGETVVVSGAAGAVGSTVGQIAKIKGARVVGIAGSEEKCSYLINELGFDAAINYKTEEVGKVLEKACPDGIDVYFDNVGGEISDAVFPLLNKFARIPVCGAISAYNKTEADIGPRVQTYLIKTSAFMKGFTVGDYSSRFKEGGAQLAAWLNEGKLKYEETIKEGFDSIIEAFLDLFKGKNLGKQLVKISEFE
ncbi:NADP-dependent oxidoreductase [Weizmannia acidilactici]|uniref:NADP-dependent oxidoreductase n=1 Tax=Weizmannia acidilactici TaxID=2607726 RepID=UPI00124C2933|nr:NADP-dependent oxidoreductase [Weizmannia acidilactici]GER67593.1 putative NADP-dependent oxidoreductase YfmJ [Weizmannia acidilactici]GER73679.1 putative NADP-dependent oxidoreductase YfmJ [Weizmannia acidilactici]